MSATQEIAASLPRLLSTHAEAAPDRIAYVGPSVAGASYLSYAAMARAVRALAGRLGALDLPPGSHIAVQLPNVAEAIVSQLAIIAAGHVCAPLPLLWRHGDAAQALRQIEARALIAWCGTAAAAEASLETALHSPSVRFVAGFGAAVPDGVVDLGDIFGAEANDDALAEADPHAAVFVTFESEADGIAAAAHTQTELLAAALDILEATHLPPAATIHATMMLSSFATIAATLTPWLVCGGSLHLSDPAEAWQSGHAEVTDLAIVPAALLDEPPLAKTHLAIWRAPERHATSVPHPHRTTIDLLSFGEHGFAVLPRLAEGWPAPLRIGTLGSVHLSRNTRGTLLLGGAMVPHADIFGELLGAADTNIPCELEAATGRLSLSGAPIGVITVGGYRFPAAALHDVAGNLEPGSTLAALPDLIAGERLAGVAANVEELREALRKAGINPLVGQAFRERNQA
ncbi:short-chain-fatty-acid--CoA ligase [Variibacter gotjawalensis]|uniref:Short-chain-fatty-acid--CoA ligase n=1 Tax=Variibacter gotjawalensis TaxID=1333996 RepID=A0A0S3PXJ7_9BRAD|nr:AMP-binding protein [Variibacter gotjawalensis]NIK46470.1 hypothetical protein [Variibacter gotjawalensis]RZS48380.1 AMP-binding enzyme [Variibacter gotjawalensis]BAT60638.1 short-chain-fatty-acid--CoA ligase [Variibacter gotjawalensis]